MLCVSLHGIKVFAARGMYPEEKIKPNEFETDVDIWLKHEDGNWPFADYSFIQKIVTTAFEQEGEMIEEFVKRIHTDLKNKYPEAEKIRVSIRKLHPPMPGDVNYAQVSYEQ